MDSSEGSEKSLEERSLLDRTARPGTPLQRRLQREEGDRPDQEEEEGQQLYTMGDRDIEGEDNVATLRQKFSKPGGRGIVRFYIEAKHHPWMKQIVMRSG